MCKSHRFTKKKALSLLATTIQYFCCLHLAKSLKKLFIIEFCSFLCKYKLINSHQFDFRYNHSTEQAFIILIETIKKSLDNDEILCEVFIDLQKVFKP